MQCMKYGDVKATLTGRLQVATVPAGTTKDNFGFLHDAKSNTSTGAAVKRYWSMGGNTMAEGDGSGNLTAEYIYFGGQRVTRVDLPSNTVHYYLSDHLGSTSIIASVAGAVEEESDYYPFGTEVPVTAGPNHYKFTGKERDPESGLDYFGARYMASTMGRFMSADPFTVAPGRVVDPQQLNLYAYVRNNPLKHIDPTGMIIDDAACKQDMKHCGKDWQKVQDVANQQDKNGNYLHPELHNVLSSLQNDSRTFTIENSNLGAGTAGLFTITNFTADGKDFTRATLQLDFKQIKSISDVTGADLVPGSTSTRVFSIRRSTGWQRPSVMKVRMACSQSRTRGRLSESSNF